MINTDLKKILRCAKCKSSRLNANEKFLICRSCNAHYSVHDNVPSLLTNGVENQEWNPWKLNKSKKTADSYYKRANGDLPEKESSKSLARLIKRKKLFSKTDNYLDIGCATGHYLVSLRKIINKRIKYTGIDISKEYLLWGNEIFGHSELSNFIHCDSLNLPFKKKSFDYTLVNLFHFFQQHFLFHQSYLYLYLSALRYFQYQHYQAYKKFYLLYLIYLKQNILSFLYHHFLLFQHSCIRIYIN